MTQTDITISPSERQVLRVVWAHPGTTSTYIIDSLHEAFHWQPPTIKTLINRLLKKGILTADTTQKQYRYHATITEEAQLHAETEDLLSHVCNTNKGNLLADMIQQVTLSQADIATLRQLLTDKQQTAPDHVSCNCLPGQCHCHHEHHGH